MFFSVLNFYKISLTPNDLKKDLLINMVTTLIMRDSTYSILMNLILHANDKRVKTIQRNIHKYKYKVSLDKLGVNKYFQFNKSFKELIK